MALVEAADMDAVDRAKHCAGLPPDTSALLGREIALDLAQREARHSTLNHHLARMLINRDWLDQQHLRRGHTHFAALRDCPGLLLERRTAVMPYANHNVAALARMHQVHFAIVATHDLLTRQR